MQQQNIWDDSLCTVDESVNSEAVCMTPNPTKEFKNSLIVNKGDIRTARKITSMETVVCQLGRSDNGSSSDNSVGSFSSVSSDSLVEIINFSRIRDESKANRLISDLSAKPWNDYEENQKFMDSLKILKRISQY